MMMTPDARALLDATIARILARHTLSEPERAGVHYELMSHLHSAAQTKATAASRATIEAADLSAAIADMGGEAELARAFVEPLARAPERVLFWRRLGAYLIDAIILGVAATFIVGVLYLALAPAFGNQVYRSAPFEPEFDFWFFPGDYPQAMGAGFAWSALKFLLYGALVLGYFTFLEGKDGRSLGKRAVGLRVVRTDGAPMTHREAIIRNLVKVSGFFLVLDTLVMLIAFRAEKQRVSDRIADTAVVRG